MNLYMYEILEDYKFAKTEAKREEIFTSFSKLIWENPNTRKLVDKPITFHIKPKLLHTEIGQVFSAYTSISRTVCPSTTKDTDFASLIRQKANNLYTHFFDETICNRKPYLELLRLPKKLYFQWQASLQKEEITWTLSALELAQTLEHTLTKAQLLKETAAREKMALSWEEFIHITDGYFRKLFENYKPLEEYQDSEKLVLHAGAWNEDNYCIRYFCNGLDGYFKNYQKKYYGLYNASSGRGVTYGRCACGNLFYRTDSTTASSATPAADKPATVLTTATTRNVKPPVIRNNLTTQLKLPQRLTKHTFVYVLATTYIQYRISYKDPLPQAERVL